MNRIIKTLCIYLIFIGFGRTLNAQIDTVYSYLDLKFLTGVNNDSLFLDDTEIGGWFYKDTSGSLPDGGIVINCLDTSYNWKRRISNNTIHPEWWLPYSMFASVGSQHLAGTISSKISQIDISQLTTGSYFLIISGYKIKKFTVLNSLN